MSARMEERMREAQAEVVQEKEDKRDISTGEFNTSIIILMFYSYSLEPFVFSSEHEHACS